MDKQVILGDICEFHEVRTQGPEGKGVKSDMVAEKAAPHFISETLPRSSGLRVAG